MQRNEALDILRGAGYMIDQVAADQWRIALAGHAYANTTIHEVMLYTLAAAIVRSQHSLPHQSTDCYGIYSPQIASA